MNTLIGIRARVPYQADRGQSTQHTSGIPLTRALADASALREVLLPELRERKAKFDMLREQFAMLSAGDVTDWDMRRFRNELGRHAGDLSTIVYSDVNKAHDAIALLVDGPLTVRPP